MVLIQHGSPFLNFLSGSCGRSLGGLMLSLTIAGCRPEALFCLVWSVNLGGGLCCLTCKQIEACEMRKNCNCYSQLIRDSTHCGISYVLIQSGITYKYRKTLAILCKLVMPIKQLFIQKQPGGVPEVSFHVTNVTGESHARSCAYHESPHDECDLFTKF